MITVAIDTDGDGSTTVELGSLATRAIWVVA